MSEFTDIPREVEASDLPAGETILWRGKPDWRFLAIDAFHAPLIALYFGLIGGWHLMAALHDGASGSAALLEASGVVFPLIVALSLVSLLAWLSARATVFTLTDRRVVMRYGMALPALINIPLGNIEAMRMRKGLGGTGDIAVHAAAQGASRLSPALALRAALAAVSGRSDAAGRAEPGRNRRDARVRAAGRGCHAGTGTSRRLGRASDARTRQSRTRGAARARGFRTGRRSRCGGVRPAAESIDSRPARASS